MKIGLQIPNFTYPDGPKELGKNLAELGHDVMIGTRDPNKLSEWHESNKDVKIGSFSETAGHGEIVFNATNGAGSLDVLKMAGKQT